MQNVFMWMNIKCENENKNITIQTSLLWLVYLTKIECSFILHLKIPLKVPYLNKEFYSRLWILMARLNWVQTVVSSEMIKLIDIYLKKLKWKSG